MSARLHRVHRVSFYLVSNRDKGSSELTPANKLDLTGLGGSILFVTKYRCKDNSFLEIPTNLSTEIRIFVVLKILKTKIS